MLKNQVDLDSHRLKTIKFKRRKKFFASFTHSNYMVLLLSKDVKLQQPSIGISANNCRSYAFVTVIVLILTELTDVLSEILRIHVFKRDNFY